MSAANADPVNAASADSVTTSFFIVISPVNKRSTQTCDKSRTRGISNCRQTIIGSIEKAVSGGTHPAENDSRGNRWRKPDSGPNRPRKRRKRTGASTKRAVADLNVQQ